MGFTTEKKAEELCYGEIANYITQLNSLQTLANCLTSELRTTYQIEKLSV